jgi:hypothetical protein
MLDTDTKQRRNNHPDQHLRNANDYAACAIIARGNVRKANRDMWLLLAKQSIDANELDVAIARIEQARSEFRNNEMPDDNMQGYR